MKRTKIEIKPGPNGHRLLTLNDVPIYSPGDPLNQAREQVAREVSPRAGVIAVLGLGLGYHLAALRELRPQAELIVWEPWENVADLFHQSAPSEIVKLERMRIVESLSDLKDALGKTLVYGPAWLNAELFIPRGYDQVAAAAAAQLKEVVDHVKLRRASNLKTILQQQPEWWSNLATNFGTVLDLPEATAAQNCLNNLPGVIVAAGPSLAKNIDVLKEAQDRLVILAVGTVFKRLIKEGIKPDVVAIIESDDKSDQVANQPDLGSTILAAYSTGHPAHLRQKPLQTLVFHPAAWIAELVGVWPFVPDGGNVASAAFTLAVLWGCNPIILVGQDLAYSEGQFYIDGARSPDRQFDQSKMVSLPGNLETTVWASNELVSYLSWYEESAAYLSKARPDLNLINATEGGARINGFPHHTLAEVVPSPECPPAKGVDKIVDALGGCSRDPELIRQRVTELRRDAERLSTLAQDESVDLAQLMAAVEVSPGPGKALAHLMGLPPEDEQLRDRIRADLSVGLKSLHELAVRLQVEAMTFIWR